MREKQYEDFKKDIMEPISKAIHLPIVWDGEESRNLVGTTLYDGDCGMYCWSDDCKVEAIVLRKKDDFKDIIETLFHEIGHSMLHPFGNIDNENIGEDLNEDQAYYLKELEAESFCLRCMQHLELPLNTDYMRCITKLYQGEVSHMRTDKIGYYSAKTLVTIMLDMDYKIFSKYNEKVVDNVA